MTGYHEQSPLAASIRSSSLDCQVSTYTVTLIHLATSEIPTRSGPAGTSFPRLELAWELTAGDVVSFLRS